PPHPSPRTTAPPPARHTTPTTPPTSNAPQNPTTAPCPHPPAKNPHPHSTHQQTTPAPGYSPPESAAGPLVRPHARTRKHRRDLGGAVLGVLRHLDVALDVEGDRVDRSGDGALDPFADELQIWLLCLGEVGQGLDDYALTDRAG